MPARMTELRRRLRGRLDALAPPEPPEPPTRPTPRSEPAEAVHEPGASPGTPKIPEAIRLEYEKGLCWRAGRERGGYAQRTRP
jgi:hypothetical protein